MALKETPVYICDFCGNEFQELTCYTICGNAYDSVLVNGPNRFEVWTGHYCNVDCLMQRLERELKK